MGAVSTFAGILAQQPTGLDDLLFTRWINTIGGTVYLLSSIVLVVASARAPHAAGNGMCGASECIDDRRARALARGDDFGTILVVRLDDAEAIAAAAGGEAFESVTECFQASVRAAVPSDADLFTPSAGVAVVYLTRPHGVVREIARDLLSRVATVSPASTLPVSLSASIGWVVPGLDEGTQTALDRADAAARVAAAAGGDRWERIVDRS